MRSTLRLILLLVAVPIGGQKIQAQTSSSQTAPAPTSLTAGIQRQLEYIESHIINLAEAMPEAKFYFTPESLGIKGSDFKGVRTFAGQIKHLATDNFDIWAPLTGEPVRSDITDVNGPEAIRTKAQIIQYLKESFAAGHKAIQTITSANAMDPLEFRGMKMYRLDLAFYALTHSQEHYGQMVVYLRMCGIIPPASRPQ
jgi:uncharacterized damage-inducible protein DinB